MGKYLTLLLIPFLLVGCHKERVIYKDKIVYVPVIKECPVAELPSRPYLPVHGLQDNDTPDQVAGRYTSSIIILQGYCKTLETALEPYSKSLETH